MDENLSSLLAEAKEAIAKGDPDTAIGLLDRILEQDLTHAEAWRLMHQELGEGQPLIAFQSEYVKSFYPERAHLFVPDAPLPRTAKIKAETAEDWIYLEDVPEQPAGRRKKKDSLRRITLPRDQEQASQNNRPQKSGLPRPKTGPIPKTKRIKTEPRPAKEKAA